MATIWQPLRLGIYLENYLAGSEDAFIHAAVSCAMQSGVKEIPSSISPAKGCQMRGRMHALMLALHEHARQTSENGFAWLGSRLLLLYLKLRAGNILKNCYPSNTRRVDGWLINEILRASYDPGALVVLESVFNFNLRVPLNFYLDSFGGKVLVIQGMRDPLSSSELRLSKIRECCSWITIRELNAGHCPHDEVPEEVNRILREWTRKCETESNLQTAKVT